MKTSLVVLAVFLFSAIAALPAVTLPVGDAAQFVEGFVEGLAQGEPDGNITACVADAGVTLEDFETGFALLDDGFSHLNLTAIDAGLKDIGSGFGEIAVVLRVCGMTDVADQIESIAAQISEGKILDVILKEVINIWHNKADVTSYFHNSINYWKQADYKNSGLYMGQLVAILLAD